MANAPTLPPEQASPAEKPAGERFRTLDPRKIIKTTETLSARVFERFPDSGLSRVASDFVLLARDLSQTAQSLKGPIWPVRIGIAVAILAGATVFGLVGTVFHFDRLSSDAALDFVQGVEASLNTVILACLGLFTLITTEERMKRKRVFRALHGLRSLIHVVDMHQLTKDPAALSPDFRPTAHSPARITDAADLARYLDYCSEMLSITGKLAALFAQSVNDAVVIDAVNDIETLGSNLSRKIWQKITLIDERAKRRG